MVEPRIEIGERLTTYYPPYCTFCSTPFEYGTRYRSIKRKTDGVPGFICESCDNQLHDLYVTLHALTLDKEKTEG